jgi:tripartite-type tricarboxylate transporter receptor subunit TctC
MIEQGFAGFESGTWVAIVAPPGTPEALAAQLGQAMSEAVRQPDVRRKMQDLAALPVGNAPAEAAAHIAAERARWRRVIQAASVTLE